MVTRSPFNNKVFGTTVEAIFKAECQKAGYHCFTPEGDYLPIDTIVYNLEAGKLYRVQIKATATNTKLGRQTAYGIVLKKEGHSGVKFEHVDVLACYVQPFDSWYLIPGDEENFPSKTIKLFPHIPKEKSRSKWQPYLENWSVFNS